MNIENSIFQDPSVLSVAVMSGKGGVGKSNIALNLGYALWQNQIPSLLMDCDLGLANLDVLLGLTPEGNLQDVLLSNADPAHIVSHIEEGGFDILPAASGVPELVDMDDATRQLLLNRLEPLFKNYRLIMLDLGAGIHDTVQSFAAMAAVRIVVLTPEPTSLTDAYALIKVLSARRGIKDFLIVVNQVSGKKEEEATFQRLYMACQRFLNITPVLLGGIREDARMPESVRRQQALLKIFPDSHAAHDIRNLAKRLLIVRSTMLGKIEGMNPLTPLAH